MTKLLRQLQMVGWTLSNRYADCKAAWLACAIVAFISMSVSWPASAQGNAQSDQYEINQRFDRQSYFKDHNIWVVSKAFAATFGMPAETVDADLRGIEAAAFRIEDAGNLLCGLAGKAENCKPNHRCMLDIYVDESKTKLPWATNERADWHWRFNSSVALRTATEKDGIPPPKTPTFTPNTAVARASSLHPFADPESTKEAIYLQNAQVDGEGDLTFNYIEVLGFKRNVIAGLTLVTFNQGCFSINKSKPQIMFRLESREAIFSPTLRRFHEFVLPPSYVTRMRDMIRAHLDSGREYFRKYLGLPSDQIPK